MQGTRCAVRLMKKAARIDHQRLASDAISTAQCHHLVGNVILVRRPLEKRAMFGLLLEGGIQVGGGSGAFQVARGNAIDEHLGCPSPTAIQRVR